MNDLEKRIEIIEARNKRVELDKKWEVSWTRRIAIALLTYIVIVSYLIAIHKQEPFINAVVPVVGFVLSTLALSKIKSWWQKGSKK